MIIAGFSFQPSTGVILSEAKDLPNRVQILRRYAPQDDTRDCRFIHR